MKPTEALQTKLYNEILSHIKQTDVNVPYRWRDYFYYSRTKEGLQYSILCRKHGNLEAPEEILLDVNELAKGQKFMSIGAFQPSDDGNLDAEWKTIVPRQPDHEYDVAHRGNLFYIRTNKGAKNFRVVTAPVSEPSEKNWKEFVAHRPSVKIDGVDLFADHAVLAEWENGLEQIEIFDFKTS